jgi:hypothetical protein
LKTSEISNEVKKLILDHINSVEMLEVLLLLNGQPNRSWTAADVSAELRTDIHSAERRLQDLSSKHLILSLSHSSNKEYRFDSQNGELDRIVGDLRSAYKVRKFTVIDLIFSKPLDAIQTFADAFKFKKE